MKTIASILLLATTLMFSKTSFAQNADRGFGQILQTYYLSKDADIVNKSIDFINKTSMDYNRLYPIVTGFFGAAFQDDTVLKSDFKKKINRVDKPEIKQLLVSLLSSNIDTIYAKTKVSPVLNDMNWSSFFATGNTKYLDNIISQIPNMENRVDVNLFLTGGSAKWSLCSNSKKSSDVNKYLNSLKDKKPFLKEVLENEPQYFNNRIIDILKKQRENGLWK
ncbi:hypothetical protein QWY86_00840 [Pedobacter aquatilis]|uniref:hypothetical protein n=1 Tax=Pedobacter aquatilis TaxID=351343 RepID=UPI0025B3F4EE|nr:hypothetical protein [Pedobacter aquatilis]MDN3585194.1 hypothetical protein [Pedobacter aquatilis]